MNKYLLASVLALSLGFATSAARADVYYYDGCGCCYYTSCCGGCGVFPFFGW